MWSEWIPERVGGHTIVSYRARVQSGYIQIEARHAPGWHTYALDNPFRVAQRLKGRISLGVEEPTRVSTSSELGKLTNWYQTKPKDFSQPEILWFSFGFDGMAQFIAACEPKTGITSARVVIRAQACDGSTCRDVEVALTLPIHKSKTSES